MSSALLCKYSIMKRAEPEVRKRHGTFACVTVASRTVAKCNAGASCEQNASASTSGSSGSRLLGSQISSWHNRNGNIKDGIQHKIIKSRPLLLWKGVQIIARLWCWEKEGVHLEGVTQYNSKAPSEALARLKLVMCPQESQIRKQNASDLSLFGTTGHPWQTLRMNSLLLRQFEHHIGSNLQQFAGNPKSSLFFLRQMQSRVSESGTSEHWHCDY